MWKCAPPAQTCTARWITRPGNNPLYHFFPHRQPGLKPRSLCGTKACGGTAFAVGIFWQADCGTQVHHGLVKIAGAVGGHDGRQRIADVLACPRVKDVIAAGGQPRRNTQYVAINGRNGFIKGDGEYRARRIVADSGELYQVAVRVGETAAVLVHHDTGGALQAAGAAVIAQALPQGEQTVLR